MSGKKGSPQKVFFEGRKYISVAGLAADLGVSVRTVLRYEARGLIERPEAIPRGAQGQRWYRAEDVEAARLAVGRGVEETARPFSEYARPGRRRARLQVDVEDELVEDEGDVEEGDVEEGRRPWWWREWAGHGAAHKDEGPEDKPQAETCPICDRELTWRVEHGDQVPRCRRHGVVDLRKPEPVEGTCVRCGREVLWERDPEARGGFSPYCERHGRTSVHPRKEEEEKQRERRWASFPLPPAAVVDERRPRGLGPRDVVYAVRAAAPPNKPVLTFVDPEPQPTRPR